MLTLRALRVHAAAAQVARMLINMHNQVAAGDFSYVEQMRADHARAQVRQAGVLAS